jgi:hypothetical protein
MDFSNPMRGLPAGAAPNKPISEEDRIITALGKLEKDAHYYHLFKNVHVETDAVCAGYNSPNDICLTCDDECIKRHNGVSNIHFKYIKSYQKGELIALLRQSKKEKYAVELVAQPADIPYGYYKLILEQKRFVPDWMLQGSFLVVKSTSAAIPLLDVIVAEFTDKRKAFTGGRRKTKSRSYKKRRSIRRNRN